MKITKVSYNFFDDNPGLLKTWCTRLFTWRKGGDGGEVTHVSTFSDNVPCLDFSFSTISACSSFQYPERDITCGVTFFKAIS